VDEQGRTPTDIPAEGSQVTGETPEGQDDAAPDHSVQVAYLHSSRVSHSWHTSMMNMIAYDKSIGQNLIRQMPYGVHCSGPNSLVEGRNMAVAHFLDKTDADWLFFVDTDMGFEPNALESLWFAASAEDRPVVGGLCFAMKHMGPDGRGGQRVLPVPTLFMFARNPKQGVGFANRFIYPPETLVQVAGTGAAFLLIHRSVLLGMRVLEQDRCKAFGLPMEQADTWFDFVQYGDGAQVSEDLSFCWRVNRLGIPIFVHTGIKVTHHKELWLSEDDYHMPPREPMQAMMDAVADDEMAMAIDTSIQPPKKHGSNPPHWTCLDVSTVGQPKGSEWVCGPGCPRD
jgi:hypothetical protein